MDVMIRVSERDCRRICELGMRPWEKLKDDENAEYKTLETFYGAAVLYKVVAGEGVTR